jgi:ribosomal protein L40E
MRPLPTWRQIPKLYRVLVILFAAADIVILLITAAGLRSWLHGAYSVGESGFYVLLLSAFFFARVPMDGSQALLERSSGTWRIAAGIVLLVVSGWAIIGAVYEFVTGVEWSDNVLEVVLFVMFLTSMGALLVWRGWQRRAGMSWAAFPTSKSLLAPSSYGERRGAMVGFLASFTVGLAVVISIDYSKDAIALQPFAWLVISAGIAVAAAILMANRRFMRKARLCLRCGQHVPPEATACTSCGRPFA